MSIRHTKSTSGLTHRLDVHGTVVTKHYREVPQFDDQVTGELIRKYWATGGTVRPIGLVPCTVDPDLDAEEIERRRLTPAEVATAIVNTPGVEALPIERIIELAIKADREQR